MVKVFKSNGKYVKCHVVYSDLNNEEIFVMCSKLNCDECEWNSKKGE